MKRSLATVWFLILGPTLLGAGAAGGDDEGTRRHTEKAGGFSFPPPANWAVRDSPGPK